MPDSFHHQNITEWKQQLISILLAGQHPGGEFQTFALTRQGEKFYIGESPFVTAHILYLLHGIEDEQLRYIIQKSINFLEKIDYTGKRIYKYWYQMTAGTAYPVLPFDLDDTAVVNHALILNKRKSIDARVILNNTDNNGFFYTWLKPSLKTIIQDASFFFVFMEYIKSYRVFLTNNDGLVMAEYNDSEIIVRMNVYIMLALMGDVKHITDKSFPVQLEEINKELSSSLHYNNVAMYYLTLSKFQKHTSFFGEHDLIKLSTAMRAYLKTAESTNNVPDTIALYLSLAYIGKLNFDDANNFLRKATDINWQHAGAFKVCIGNKKFKDYHEYCSYEFTIAMAVSFLNIIYTMKQ
jgi:hypothetical protein